MMPALHSLIHRFSHKIHDTNCDTHGVFFTMCVVFCLWAILFLSQRAAKTSSPTSSEGRPALIWCMIRDKRSHKLQLHHECTLVSFSLYFSNTGLVWFWKVSHLMPNCGWSYGICPEDLASFDYAFCTKFSLGSAFQFLPLQNGLFGVIKVPSCQKPLLHDILKKNIMFSENC